eukprot:TRINITY_DN32994_c0_g1_i1.p1 TRINITY_DN32994_c0_g1~~TRINITY_DN32994_c0_g1_i1.p1  ORF type:complete len:211 (-),score=11.01 TRINITY_DN32994_c0_g1_i1:59-643(-)
MFKDLFQVLSNPNISMKQVEEVRTVVDVVVAVIMELIQKIFFGDTTEKPTSPYTTEEMPVETSEYTTPNEFTTDGVTTTPVVRTTRFNYTHGFNGTTGFPGRMTTPWGMTTPRGVTTPYTNGMTSPRNPGTTTFPRRFTTGREPDDYNMPYLHHVLNQVNHDYHDYGHRPYHPCQIPRRRYLQPRVRAWRNMHH